MKLDRLIGILTVLAIRNLRFLNAFCGEGQR